MLRVPDQFDGVDLIPGLDDRLICVDIDPIHAGQHSGDADRQGTLTLLGGQRQTMVNGVRGATCPSLLALAQAVLLSPQSAEEFGAPVACVAAQSRSPYWLPACAA